MKTSQATLSPTEQVHLHFALGKAYDDVGQRDQSFQHLREGNALQRSLISYDAHEMQAFMDRIQSVFTATLFQNSSPLSHSENGPIFILGMPRSGTTLVEQILASHQTVTGGGELGLFKQAIAETIGGEAFPEAVMHLPPQSFTQQGNRYLDSLKYKFPNASRITDKMPQNFLFAGLIHLALPNAKIIHTRRNPLDTCLSCFSKLFVNSLPYTYDLAELGLYYRGYATLMDHWRTVLPHGVMIDVDYEDVVNDLEGQTRRILDYCGLEWDSQCLDFHKTERTIRTASATEVRQPLYKTSVGRWRPADNLLHPLLDALSATI